MKLFSILGATAITLAMPAVAQAATPAEAAPAAQSNPVTATAPSEPADASASMQADATASPERSAQVAAVIEAGFPKYDADGSGDLSQAEFRQWISDLKTQEMAAQGKTAAATEVTQYAQLAMRSADRDANKIVSRDELVAFLGG